MIAAVIEGLGVATTGIEPRRAATLLGAADGVRTAVGVPLQPDERADHESSLASIVVALDDRTFTEAWHAGRTMPWDEAVAYTLDDEHGG